MSRSLFDQDTQVHKSGTYDDTIAPSLANYETNPASLEDDLNCLRSMASELRDVRAGEWYDALAAPSAFPGEGAAARGVQDVNEDLYDIERKRILRRRAVIGADVTVPASVHATNNLLFNSLPLANETVTIDTKVYTFKAALTPAEGEVLIGANKTASRNNLVAAINHDAGFGVTYQCAVAHPTVSAVNGAGDSLDATAREGGTHGNAIATTETLSDGLSIWSAGATLAGGSGGDVVILDGGANELPGNTTAAVGITDTRGTIVASVAGSFGVASLNEVTNADSSISPKNLCVIVDTATGDPIMDSQGREIYGLLQSEIATQGHTINLVNQRVQLTFVVRTVTYDDLVYADGDAIAGSVIDYSPIERYAFDDIPEQAWLGDDFVDVGAGSATRQSVYDNQGAVPVDLTTNAILDIESAGKYWEIRDSNEASLFKITENAVAGTSEVALGSDVDSFNVDAAVNDFAEGVTVDSGGVDLQLGITVIANTATIDTLAATDLRLMGGRELFLDDVNQTGSAWVQTSGIKLSDTTQEWDDFRTIFGEVSLLDAIVQSYNSLSRCKAVAYVSVADINANTLIEGPGGPGAANISADLCDYDGLTFVDDVDIYINGALQWNGANAAANNDVYPALNAAERQVGCFYAEFDLKFRAGVNPDVITMIVWGTPP